MTIRLGKTGVRIHPLLMGLWGFCLLLGGGPLLLPALSALALHEAGHAAMARCFGKRISSLEITPFGAVMTIPGEDSLPPLPAFLIAAAGPFCSLAGCLLSPALLQAGAASFPALRSFARYCLMMLLLNLLPTLPLDGGRMLRAALRCLLPGAAAERWLIRAGTAAGIALIAVSVFFACRGQLLLPPCFAGLYLLYASATERRRTGTAYITGLISRRQRMEEGGALPVEEIALCQHTPLRSVLPYMNSGRYHVITVLAPDGLTRLGRLEEKQFCEMLLRDAGQSLGDCLPEAGAAGPTAKK